MTSSIHNEKLQWPSKIRFGHSSMAHTLNRWSKSNIYWKNEAGKGQQQVSIQILYTIPVSQKRSQAGKQAGMLWLLGTIDHLIKAGWGYDKIELSLTLTKGLEMSALCVSTLALQVWVLEDEKKHWALKQINQCNCHCYKYSRYSYPWWPAFH